MSIICTSISCIPCEWSARGTCRRARRDTTSRSGPSRSAAWSSLAAEPPLPAAAARYPALSKGRKHQHKRGDRDDNGRRGNPGLGAVGQPLKSTTADDDEDRQRNG